VTVAVVTACAAGALLGVRRHTLGPAGSLEVDPGTPLAPGTVLMSVATVALVIATAAFVAGGFRGPVMGDPFAVMVTMDAASSPKDAVRRFWRAAWPVVAALPVLRVAVLMAAGHERSAGTAVCGVAFGLITGLVAAVAWLAGQVWPRAARVCGGTALWVVAALAIWWPAFLTAHDWLAFLALGGPDTGPVTAWIGGLGGALALAGAAATPWLARRLDPIRVLGQAIAWEATGVAVMSGWASEALAPYRSLPAHAWGRALPRRGSWTVVFVQSDLIGLVRTPGRAAAGAAGLLVAGWAAASALTQTGPIPPGPLGAMAAIIAYAALGTATDSLRDWAAEFKGHVTMGVRPGRLAAVRLITPATVSVVLQAAGAAAALARLEPDSARLLCLLAAPLAWTAVPLAARLGESLRGARPDALSVPVMTPFGDLSPVMALVWHIDAPLAGGLFGWLVAAAAATNPVAAAAVAVAFLAIMATGAALRAKRHR
jgi:hypothetical protein